MNRRQFIKSLAAACALPAAPALSIQPVAAALPAAGSAGSASAAALATKARFWAIYMNGLQGSCSPATLSAVLNIPETEARNYVTRFVADGLIKPNPLLRKTAAKVAEVVKAPTKDLGAPDDGEAVLDKIEAYVEELLEDEGEILSDFAQDREPTEETLRSEKAMKQLSDTKSQSSGSDKMTQSVIQKDPAKFVGRV